MSYIGDRQTRIAACIMHWVGRFLRRQVIYFLSSTYGQRTWGCLDSSILFSKPLVTLMRATSSYYVNKQPRMENWKFMKSVWCPKLKFILLLLPGSVQLFQQNGLKRCCSFKFWSLFVSEQGLFMCLFLSLCLP